MTRALIIGDTERAAVTALIAKAAGSVTPLATVERLAEWKDRTGAVVNPLHDEFTIALPVGFRVTYTHEQQKQCVCRHMSVSIDAPPPAAPSPAAVNELLALFGFKNRIPAIVFWLDKGERVIINLLEPLDGDLSRLEKRP